MKMAFLCKPAPAPAPQPATPATQPTETLAVAPGPETPVAETPATEEPAAEPQRERRTRAARAAAGMSIKSMMTEEKPVEQVVSKDEPAPSEEAIRAAWPSLAQKYSDKPRLATMLNSTTLEITGDDTARTVVFEVVSQAQKDWVESKLLYDLEGYLRVMLKTTKIYLRVSVKPDDAPVEKKPYMPSEKAIDLMNSNPEVNNLVKDLGLEIK